MIEDLSLVLDTWLFGRLEQVHTALPGVIVSYEGHKTRRARVQPTIRKELGTGPIVEIPPIDGVPVIFPSTKDAQILFPIKPGDTVLLIFCETGIGRWLKGDGSVSDPTDQTRHSLTDAVAIPGLWSWKGCPQTSAPEDALFVSYKKSQMTLSGDTFSMKDGGGNSVVSSGKTLTLNGNLEVDQ